MEKGTTSELRSYVHVRVGNCDIAISINEVRQAVPQQVLTALPRRSGALVGVANVRGAAVPVVELQRWLPIDRLGDPDQRRLLVLERRGALVGIPVDAVLGVIAVRASALRRIHHQPDHDELFESVVPETSNTPTLCVLEVARLMQLTQAWCFEAGHGPSGGAACVPHVVTCAGKTRRHAVFQIGNEQWAVPLDAVLRVLPLPPVELALGHHAITWGICQVMGRKLALVDISARHQASSLQDAPWMAMLGSGTLALGLTVSACQQFVELEHDSIARSPGDTLSLGVALLPGLGKLQVLDIARLFSQVALAAISQADNPATLREDTPGLEQMGDPSPYLVFESDQRYATPLTGIVGVVPLPEHTRDDLRQGKPAALTWRGRTLAAFNLPTLNKTVGNIDSRLAVLVQPQDPALPPVGIAIKGLTDWLPPYSAARRGMRMNAVGEFCMINGQGNSDYANLVVVDLAQMAYLLG